MEDTQKTAASIAAVLQYIKTEEEAVAMQSAMQAAQSQMPRFAQPPAPACQTLGRQRPAGPNAAAQFDATQNIS